MESDFLDFLKARAELESPRIVESTCNPFQNGRLFILPGTDDKGESKLELVGIIVLRQDGLFIGAHRIQACCLLLTG